MNGQDLRALSVSPEGWDRLPGWGSDGNLMEVLRGVLPTRRWFGGKARTIKTVRLESAVPLEGGERGPIFFCILRVDYESDGGERYGLPLARAREGEVPGPGEIARLDPPSEGYTRLVDGFFVPETGQVLLGDILSPAPVLSGFGRVQTDAILANPPRVPAGVVPTVFRGEQSNTSILFGRALMLKGFRRLEPGMNPDLEVGAFLARMGSGVPIPTTFGALLGGTPEGEPLVLVLLQEFVDNRGDAWTWFLSRLLPVLAGEEDGEVLDAMVSRLGFQTARLHRALGSDPADPDFSPLPFGVEDLSRLVEEIRERADQLFRHLEPGIARLPEGVRRMGENLLLRKGELENFLKECDRRDPGGLKIRCHGDFHLGQVLVTPDNDVVFLDFEGEPALPLAKRRLRTTPLQDVAGMLRSFHYLAMSATADRPEYQDAAYGWYTLQSRRYLHSYRTECAKSEGLLPSPDLEHDVLALCLLRKALYETEYELNNRPGWLFAPLAGIDSLLRALVLERGERE